MLRTDQPSWLHNKDSLTVLLTNEDELSGRSDDVCFVPKYIKDKTQCNSGTKDGYVQDFFNANIYEHSGQNKAVTKVPYLANMLGGKKKRRKKTRTNRKKSLRHNKPKLTIIKRRFKSKKRKGKKRRKTRKRKN